MEMNVKDLKAWLKPISDLNPHQRAQLLFDSRKMEKLGLKVEKRSYTELPSLDLDKGITFACLDSFQNQMCIAYVTAKPSR